MGIVRQTKVLLRKNYRIKRRNYKETLQEVLVPIYWILLLLVIKLGVRAKVLPSLSSEKIPTCNLMNRTSGKCFPTDSRTLPNASANLNTAASFGFTFSNNGSTKTQIMLGYVTNGDKRAVEVINMISNRTRNEIEYREFSSSEEMASFYKKLLNSRMFGLGLVFQNSSAGHQLGYTIRMPFENSPNVKTKIEDKYFHRQCRNPKTLFIPGLCLANSYIVYGAATLQVVVDAAITQVETNISSGFRPPDVLVKMMPKGTYTPSLEAFSSSKGIYLVLAFTPYIIILVVYLVKEKEDKSKELMRIMGMQDSAYWLSWIITYSIIIFVGVLIMNSIAAAAKIFGNSNFVLMVIIFYLFGLSLIAFSFMISPLFKKSKVAGTVTMLLNVVFGLLILPINAFGASNAVKWALSLLSPTAFTLAIAPAVEVGQGLQFDNVTTKGTFPAVNGIIMIILDSILYLIIASYLDVVIPGEYGRRREPHFFLKPSFWKGLLGKNNKILQRQSSERIQNELAEDIEPVPVELHGKEAIRIHKVRKVFHGKEDVVAVDGVSLDIYEGQVTALLGHNGAGKTTLIATLTGMTPPTSGVITIYGMDVTDPNDLFRIRKTIGVCPQQNVLFDFLTVKEHIEFYGGIKEVDQTSIQDTVNSIINKVGLEDQRDTLAKDLSGGQKRKLCVGMALIGNPKVVLLDEPTSGMDPYSRRQMWTLLRSCCKDRVMLLTTHFMDEADILADYKAILSKGKLRCAGSSLFLKNRFGIGYHLNMSLAETCSIEQLVEAVKSKVRGAEVLRHYGREMAFLLPMEEVSNFSELFAFLEESNESQEGYAAKELGVNSYGVSMTTLEEVFLQLEETNEEEKVKQDHQEEVTQQRDCLTDGNFQLPNTEETLSVEDGNRKFAGSSSNLRSVVDLNSTKIRSETRKSPFIVKQQFLGLLKIRWLNSKRSPAKIFFMMFIPPLLLTIGMVIMGRGKDSENAITQSMALSPSLYITPASSENFATQALVQNSTKHTLENILKQFAAYKVGVKGVQSVDGFLNASRHTLVNLGFDVRQFPANMKSYNTLSSVYRKYLMYYNNTMLHSVPVGLNILGSTFHMLAQQLKGLTPHPIETKIHLFPPLTTQWKYDNTAFISIMLIGMAFVFIPGGFAIEVVSYRQSNIRHMLRLSGVSPFMYWMHFLVADGLVFLAPVLLCFILVGAFQIPSLSSAPALGCFALEVLVYLASGLLFTYTVSFLFNKWETAQSVTSQLYGFLGFLPFLAVALVDMINSPFTAIIIHYVALALSPPYAIFGALYYIDRIHRIAATRAQSNDVTVPAGDYFAWSKTITTIYGTETQYNGIPGALLMPVIHSIIFFLLLYVLDQRSIGNTMVCSCGSSERRYKKPSIVRSLSIRSSSSFRSIDHDDEDVMQEKQKIIHEDEDSPPDNSHAVVVKGLWKKFGRKDKAKMAVKDLYFAVEQGEVFGLLGPNGAGKTSTLKMITRDITPSAGQVIVAGFDISENPLKAFQHMGYCPQADTLWSDVTLEEHLEVYARIRGVPWDEVKTVVDHFLRGLKIEEHAGKLSKALSGGTKRKLSFAMAMLGDPQLLLLDEPSTGMDPSSRRFLWDTISKNVHGKRGAILTTHSMEEADALSSRVGIMVKGELRCVGSTQHLKNKFGSGYSLEIKLSHPTLQHESETAGPDHDPRNKLYQFVAELFPSAVRTESFGTRVIYKVPKESVLSLSKAFLALEKGKQEVGIEEYSFSQSTLEQVFLEFAREQDDDRTGGETDDKTVSPSIAASPQV